MIDPDDAPKGPVTAEQPVTNRTLHGEFMSFFRKQFGGNVLALVIIGGGSGDADILDELYASGDLIHPIEAGALQLATLVNAVSP